MLSLLSWISLTTGLALAHPNGAQYHSLRTSVKVTDQALMVVVGLEVPNAVVLTEFQQRYADLARVHERQQAEFRELMWDRLAEGLALEVGGEVVDAPWRPLKRAVNGRAGEQFFTYLVGCTVPDPAERWGDRLDVVVTVDSFAVPGMVLSSYATQTTPWSLVSTSASELLGEYATASSADAPAAWTTDASLRRVEVVYQRAQEQRP